MKLTSLIAIGAAIAALAQNEFVSTWKADGVTEIDFAGRKVAAVLVSDDTSLRVPTEEALAREITARGPVGVPSYRIMPKELFKDKDAAKQWFERASIAGLVVLRPVNVETDKVYSSAVWASGYYNYAWDYWGTSWATVIPLGKGRDQHTLTVETVLFDLSKGTPIWGGVTRTTDPKNVQTYVKSLAIDVVKKLEKEGLVKKRP